MTDSFITNNNKTTVSNDQLDAQHYHHHLDTTGLICPEPVMMLHKAIRQADAGELIEVIATDPATTRDIPNFCRHLGHRLLQQQTIDNVKVDNTKHAHNDDSNQDNLESETTHYRYVIEKKPA